ncbi:MAG: hypothetical protein AB1779_03850 [Candidatus Thermoplasmatota archaeon]
MPYKKKNIVRALFKKLGGRYSTELGINLTTKKNKEIFRWFIAAILFGAPIKERTVKRTYKEFEERNLLCPKRICSAQWEDIVDCLDEGGYTRYDFKTADKLIELSRNLNSYFDGDLNKLHESAKDLEELKKKLSGLAKGIGETTINIFLREMRDVWKLKNVGYAKKALLSAKNIGLIKDEKDIKPVWNEIKSKGWDFIDFESALLRLGKNYCFKLRCDKCHFTKYCKLNR